jgi:hypothetical protein
MDKDQHVSVNQPSDSEPGLRVRAVDASDVTGTADPTHPTDRAT